TSGSAGFDLVAVDSYIIKPHETVMIDVGWRISLPKYSEAQIRSRSSLSLAGIVVAGGIGTIDPDYQGDIGVPLHNLSLHAYHVKKGDKVAQMVIQYLPRAIMHVVEDFHEQSERGTGGFGSTGR